MLNEVLIVGKFLIRYCFNGRHELVYTRWQKTYYLRYEHFDALVLEFNTIHAVWSFNHGRISDLNTEIKLHYFEISKFFRFDLVRIWVKIEWFENKIE